MDYSVIPENHSSAVIKSGQYFRMPRDIPTDDHFWDTFGQTETEISARVIVKLCQEVGVWKPFTEKEINEFWKEDVWFNGLVTKGWIIKFDDLYYVTEAFVDRCYHKLKKTQERIIT